MTGFERAPKLFDFYSILSDNGKLIDYLRKIYLLDNERSCRKCAKKMKLSKRASKMDMEEWRCDSCLSMEFIRINSTFEVNIYL